MSNATKLAARIAEAEALLVTLRAAASSTATAAATAQPDSTFAERMRAKAKHRVVAIDLTVCSTELAYALSTECPEAYRVTLSKAGTLYFHGERNAVLGSRAATEAELALRKGRVPAGVSRR